MSTAAPSPQSAIAPELKVACRATALVMFLYGIALAAWAPLVPLFKERIALDDRTLGFFLPCVALGSIVAAPVVSRWVAKVGCRAVLTVSSLIFVAMFVPLATISNVYWLGPVLFVFGFSSAMLSITVNIQAVALQNAIGRPIVAGLHGRYSVGSIAGAMVITSLFSSGLRPWVVVLLMIVVLLGLLAIALPNCSHERTPTPARAKFAWPKGIVLIVGILCFLEFLCEGAVGDWSGVFLKQERAFLVNDAGWGYACYAGAMMLGRLLGDRWVQAWGTRTLLMSSAVLGAIGFAMVALLPWGWIALVGFALVGLGTANIMPILFSSAGRQKDMPLHKAMASVTTMGYLGSMAGPLIIGSVAQGSSLVVSFLVLMMAQVLIATAARKRI